MTTDAKVLAADDHRVGFTVTTTQGVFHKLLELSAEPDLEGWSTAITKLIERARP